ncbi:MAG TPA: multidrug DMT transporter permease, partial [Puia sp.]
MVIIESYPAAVILCLITMICWGSWANTMKLTGKNWFFQLYYWDYSLGVLIFSLLLAFTLGSHGSGGRSFLDDLSQAESKNLGYAFLAGTIFNLSNVLLVTVIDIAGMAIAFPIGVGLALVLGVITGYISKPLGNPWILFTG